jgi:hypothetical protein
MARDARLFDLGLIVGAQVKAGSSWFSEPATDESGALVGWWFRDSDRRHVDAWLRHSVPHIVVLHNPEAQVSYWAHVTPEAVVGTGKGAKLLVRIDCTIDQERRDDLLRVAAAKRLGGSWEGSAWAGGTAIAPSALLRHAMLVPRLIAPHRNSGHRDPISAAQGIALVVSARLADLRAFGEAHAEVPSLDELLNSSDWTWRLVGALFRRVTTEDRRPLVDVVPEAPRSSTQCAAVVAAASAMIEDGLPDQAHLLLAEALTNDTHDPVNHAWLSAQRCRALIELGNLAEARDLAAQIQVLGATHAGDPTATAIAGAAGSMLFSASGWGQVEVGKVLTGADTIATWWRAQSLARGLTDLAEREFRSWAPDNALRFSNADEANNQLLSAGLTASLTGDQAGDSGRGILPVSGQMAPG